jgi:hypothetical protein
MKRPEIVKVQRLLYPRNGPALIYDQKRERQQQVELPDDVRHQMGGELKAYFEAEWSRNKWRIGKRVAKQPW